MNEEKHISKPKPDKGTGVLEILLKSADHLPKTHYFGKVEPSSI
jgi:hypothetical protein